MKLLTATKELQGQRKNDFNHATEGELVKFGSECDCESVDGVCGCKRSLVGLVSHKATTTFKVLDVDISHSELERQIEVSLATGGWAKLMDEKELAEMVRTDAKDLMNLGEHFKEGTIIEKRGSKFQSRVELPQNPKLKKGMKIKFVKSIRFGGFSCDTFKVASLKPRVFIAENGKQCKISDIKYRQYEVAA